MMKKILIAAIVIVIIFIALTYISVSETKKTFDTCTVLSAADMNQHDFKKYDSVLVAANTIYEASDFKKIMQGEQYRDAWAQPVMVPIVYLDTLKGGLKLIEEGGGKQTHSLELEDSLGIRYTLRSLSKDASKLIPKMAKNLGLENIVVDGISAQHPYAALVVAELSREVNILHTHPTLYFVPKQKILSGINDKYGNRLYFLEYESEGEKNWTDLKHIDELLDTEDLQELKIEKGPLLKIDENQLIRCRLFDLIIGDWDRHPKQWGWAIQKNGTELLAIPIPTDRDNAFFNQNGILPNLITNNQTLPKIQNFEAEIDYIQGLVIDFDVYFLRNSKLEQFTNEAKYLQRQLDDKTINASFNVWPKSIDSLNGPAIRKIIKSRRDSIVVLAKRFYNTMMQSPQKNIILIGSEELELPENLSQCFCD
ncbi:hypothetical protein [Maribacter sp. 2210JD10-5]|uniref:hypothetical protein n=1 Tax=Maribacter sp. 2210JD10-5 TaxID=3386272 RepID=UPI0039BD2DCF